MGRREGESKEEERREERREGGKGREGGENGGREGREEGAPASPPPHAVLQQLVETRRVPISRGVSQEAEKPRPVAAGQAPGVEEEEVSVDCTHTREYTDTHVHMHTCGTRALCECMHVPL